MTRRALSISPWHVETTLRTHPTCTVELDVQCLGVAHPARTLPDGTLVPAGFFAEGEFMSEPLSVWTDLAGGSLRTST